MSSRSLAPGARVIVVSAQCAGGGTRASTARAEVSTRRGWPGSAANRDSAATRRPTMAAEGGERS